MAPLIRSAKRSIAAILVVGAVASPAVARAQPEAPRVGTGDDAKAYAADQYKRGQTHFDLSEYDEAIAAFKEAYRAYPRPGLLYNLGQAYRLKGDCANAARMYGNYLRLEPEPPHRAVVEQQLTDMETCARERGDEADDDAPGDDATAESVSTPVAPPATGPGSGGPAVTTTVGSEPPGKSKRLIGLISLGVGAVLMGTGTYFALDAAAASDEVDAFIEQGGAWSDIESTNARGERSELIGVSLLVTGAAALATGAVFYALGWREGRAPTVVVSPRPSSPSVGVAWQF